MPNSTSGSRAALAALVLAASLARPLGAEDAYVVRDIAPGPGLQRGSDMLVVPTGDRIFLLADDDDHGRELWTTDGTAGGTRLVRDICPGRCYSHPQPQGSLGDRLLFSASTGARGHTLWISDGTWEGTRQLGSGALPVNGPASVGVGFLEDRGLFFFAARRGAETGLWVTDGTRAGTRPVGVGGPDGWPLDPQGFSTARGRLFFAASLGYPGPAPWVTDGTEQGTRRLVDVASAPTSRYLDRGFHRLPAGTVFFVRHAFSEPCQTTLWRSDGTPAGTVPVKVFDDPACLGEVVASPVLAAGGALYFNAQDGAQPRQLWRSDGTAAGTRPLTAFDGAAFEPRFEMVASGDAVLFPADDGATGFEPWIADAAGARRLVDLCPGTCSSRPEELARVAGRFYFQAADGTHGDELFRSDGTAAGTRLVHDACPGDCDSRPTVEGVAGGRVYFKTALSEQRVESELWAAPAGGDGAVRVTDLAPDLPFEIPFSGAALGDRFLFAADDGEHGRELWRSDGTAAGTGLVADVRHDSEVGAGSYPVRVTSWGDGVLFFADDPDFGYQPWFSDGTEAGTRRLGQVVLPDRAHFQAPYSTPVILGAHALFLADGDSGLLELWRTTPSGPPVKLLALPGTENTNLSSLRESVRLGDRAVFMVQRGFDSDGGVWVSDGTAAGSVRLGEITIGNLGSQSSSGELGGRLYFNAAGPGSEDFELWRTDGTAAGTARVADVAPGPEPSGPTSFARLGDRLLFAATTEAEGRELWATDGTAAGTRLVADLVPGPLGSSPYGLTAAGDRVLFFVPSGGAAVEIWSSDGTAAGTAPLAAFSGDAVPLSDAPNRAVAGGRLFFTFINFNGPADLWVSDGTVAGTGSLRPLLPPFGHVHGVWSAGDRVRVSLWFSTDVNELWETDGTLAGTRRLVSLSSLGLVRPIAQLAEAGSLLYFQGPHPEAGAELMALPLGPPAPCAADAETLCLRDGRFAVRVRWRDPRTGNQGVGGATPLPGSDHSGLFWFFDPANVELVVKTLDGGGVNGHFWNFYGALSDVEYWIEVRDTATGQRVEYHNPEGEICGRGDTVAFRSREPVPLPVPPAPVPAPAVVSTAAPGGSACGGGPGDLCLHGDRFRVEVDWTDQRTGNSGAGTAVPGTDRSGFFWFFDDENVELVVKVLDGRPVNGRFWVFYGALSDVGYTIAVTDTETAQTAVYTNPPGEICGRGDTAAF